MNLIKYSNDKKYGLSIAAFLADDEYDHSPVKGPYLSVTGMLKPDRMMVLDQRVKLSTARSDVPEVIDIDRFVPSAIGTAIHSAIEHSWTRMQGNQKAYVVALRRLGYPEDVIKQIKINPTPEDFAANPNLIPIYMELRAIKKVGPYSIGGKFDFIGNGFLEDFKTMGTYGYIKADKDEEHIMQGSLYRWLNPELVTEDIMKIQYIFTDWSKLEAIKGISRGYPQTRILEKQLKLKPIEEMQKWVENKIATIEGYKDTPEADLPFCSQKDLWQSDPVYKYYGKPGAKRASKVFDNQADAFAWGATKGTGEVKEFGGQVKRCGYCNAYELCTQKDIYAAAGILQLPA